MDSFIGFQLINFPKSLHRTLIGSIVLLTAIGSALSQTAWSANLTSNETSSASSDASLRTSPIARIPKSRDFAIDLAKLAALTQAFAVEGHTRSKAYLHVEYGTAALELESLQRDVESFRERVAGFDDEIASRRTTLATLEAQSVAAKSELAELAKQKQATQATIDNQQARVVALTSRQDQLNDEIEELERKKRYVSSSEIRERWHKLSRAHQAEYLIKYLQGDGDPEAFFPPDGE